MNDTTKATRALRFGDLPSPPPPNPPNRHWAGSESGSSDSEGGGVLLSDNPSLAVEAINVENAVASWLSSLASLPSHPIPTSVLRFDRSFDLKKEITNTPIPNNEIRNKTAAASSATPTLPKYHLSIIKSLVNTPYEGVCPFFTAAACPQGPKCALKVLKPSTVTICPHYLKTGVQNAKRQCLKKGAVHRSGFLHLGDEGYGAQFAMKHLRSFHEKGVWGVVGAEVGFDGVAG